VAAPRMLMAHGFLHDVFRCSSATRCQLISCPPPR
jgi:hypothetical protein